MTLAPSFDPRLNAPPHLEDFLLNRHHWSYKLRFSILVLVRDLRGLFLLICSPFKRLASPFSVHTGNTRNLHQQPPLFSWTWFRSLSSIRGIADSNRLGTSPAHSPTPSACWPSAVRRAQKQFPGRQMITDFLREAVPWPRRSVADEVEMNSPQADSHDTTTILTGPTCA